MLDSDCLLGHVIPFNVRKMKVFTGKNNTFCYISIKKIVLDSKDVDIPGRERAKRASAKIYAHMSATLQNLVATPLPPHIYISSSAPGRNSMG